MLLVSLSDFTGYFMLARSIQLDTIIQAYIDRYEKQYIREILGVELGDLYIADLANPSQDPRFVVIEDAFAEQDGDEICGGKIHESKGLKDILMSLIYYHYVQETQVQHTQTGMNKAANETNVVMSPRQAARQAEKYWNESLDSIDAIQWYCSTFVPDDYPEFKGIKFKAQYLDFI